MKKFLCIVVCAAMIIIAFYECYNSIYLAAGPHTEIDYSQSPFGVEKKVGWNYPKAIKRTAFILVPEVVAGVVLVVIVKCQKNKRKKNESEYSQNMVNADGSNEEIPSNMWKCSRCGKLNANFLQFVYRLW